MISPEEIERAKNLWAAGFFSWSDDVSEEEIDAGYEGFLAGVNFTLKQIGTEKLALLVLIKWLGSMSHFTHQQLEDLKKLSDETLTKLLKSEPVRKTLDQLIAEGTDAALLERFWDRHRMTMSVRQAEEQGLYDLAEHLSGDQP